MLINESFRAYALLQYLLIAVDVHAGNVSISDCGCEVIDVEQGKDAYNIFKNLLMIVMKLFFQTASWVL